MEIWPGRQPERCSESFRPGLCFERRRNREAQRSCELHGGRKAASTRGHRAQDFGQWQYVTDVRVPGMLHGRVVRPARAGAKLVSLDEGSAKAITGYVKTVVDGNFVGVVAESEWAAIRAAQALKVTWTERSQHFPSQVRLYDYMRSVHPRRARKLSRRVTLPPLWQARPGNRKRHTSGRFSRTRPWVPVAPSRTSTWTA